MSPATDSPDGCLLRLWVQPRASRTQIAGLQADAIKVRVAAPPVDGAANDALLRFLAKQLGTPRRELEIVAGSGSRRKSVRVAGLGGAEALRRLGLG